MSPVRNDHIDEVRATIHEILGGQASGLFLGRLDKILEEWAGDKLTAADACTKIQKNVSLFLSEKLASLIKERCAMILMRETSGRK